MRKLLYRAGAAILILSLILAGCSGKESPASSDPVPDPSAVVPDITPDKTDPSHTATLSYSDEINMTFTDSDVSSTVDTSSATMVSISGDDVTVSGEGASYAEGTLSITSEGTYVLSGTSDDILILIETGDDEKVGLVLDNCTLSNTDGPVIWIKESDKVFIHCPEGSVSSLSDGETYADALQEDSIDGCIFSKADLTLNGSGTLILEGNCKHALVSKDDLVIAGLTLNVQSVSKGIEGKDCVKVTGAVINVVSGTDGIASTNSKDADKGYVFMEDSTVDIRCGNDGIEAATLVFLDSSSISVDNTSTDSTGSSDSFKGIKSDLDICLKGCEISVSTRDDSIHADETVVIDGGSYTLSSHDDGIHADKDLSILDGTVTVSESTEGIEATVIDISGGIVTINAGDDGINAAGGNNQSSGHVPAYGKDDFSSGKGELIIDGGYVYVNSMGDGLDANGTITINGGITLVSGPVNNGNAAIDYDVSATMNGGILIATGSAGMAQNFSESNGQASIMYDTGNQSEGTSISITDENGNVLLSFTPEKDYQTVVFSSPKLQKGNSYIIISGGTISGTDAHGLAQSGKINGGKELTEIELESNIFGASHGLH
jgi:hypothetical protein